MARDTVDLTPIQSRDELVSWIAKGEKHGKVLKVGTEHEKFGFYRKDNSPVPYEGGIGEILKRMQALSGWEPIYDGAHIIGLADEKGGGAISLEPGGQFELSGAPFETLHETRAEFLQHAEWLKQVSEPLGIDYLLLGLSPKWTRAETPMMPKSRYKIMMRYMPTVGNHGLDMMFRTSTVQANLDFTSEADMVRKMRVALSWQPIATALFANSPFLDGRLNGYRTMRSAIWLDTDADRTGMLPFAFEEGFGYERYVDYALDVPLYFVKRGDTYHDVAGQSFRDLMQGKLPGLPGERAVLSDWVNHLGTIFPEVRLKRYLEMRGADAGPLPVMLALPALFVGLLYDNGVLDAAWDVVHRWSNDDRLALRRDVPRLALGAEVAGVPVRELAREMLTLARAGLKRRARFDASGQDESHYLDPLEVFVREGRVAADHLIADYNGRWGGSVEPVFAACRM